MRAAPSPPRPRARRRILWSELAGAGFAWALAELAREHEGPMLVILNQARAVPQLTGELDFFGAPDLPPVRPFPGWECLPYDTVSPHPNIISARMRVLSELGRMRQGIVVTGADNALQRLPPPDYVLGRSFVLGRDLRLSPEALRAQLAGANYRAVPQVRESGEYAVRGGIIDVFPTGGDGPLRIEWFDDRIESLRRFDPDTQRSGEEIERIDLLPAREFPLDDEAVARFREGFRRCFSGDPTHQSLYRAISDGKMAAGIEHCFPLFFESTADLFDYLPEESLIVIEGELEAALEAHWRTVTHRAAERQNDPLNPVLPPEMLYLSPAQAMRRLAGFARIAYHAQTERTAFRIGGEPPDLQAPPNSNQPFSKLFKYLRGNTRRILCVAESDGRREALTEALTEGGFSPVTVAGFAEFRAGDMPLALCSHPLERGMALDGQSIALVSESQLYGDQVFQRRRRSQMAQDPESVIRSLGELQPGDLVVHEQHGVGRYCGIETVEIEGERNDFVRLEYAEEATLYLPVLDLHWLSRAAGTEDEEPPLHALGGRRWQKARQRARKQAHDTASELIAVSALRAAESGTAQPLPQPDYDEFVRGFPFTETPDQAQAIDEVLADLAAPKPMDRLVCGDVGFGKTEVALRAAMVAVGNGGQVALLAPTTLLAEQHARTFRDRFAGTPVRIAGLSRIGAAKANAETTAGLQAGTIDIVIGTHQLLQSGVQFHNLRLLIVDEEQRFGVRQKEALKRRRGHIDLLTLSATPIPRTLNMALAGLRDISLIATPPQARLPVRTFLRDWSPGTVRDACLRELGRGGQIYYLHNDVRSIEAAAEELAELLPEAEIRVAHGQLPRRTLERVMQDFYHRRFNMLVCSTIIENGLDLPAANTILIDRADRFGLAQLHQLRGRVGRSHHQAYAYLLVADSEHLREPARRRLESICRLEALGTGFLLARHDLEIRGAGELLGESQSGMIDEVGYSLYCEYLARAVAQLQGRPPPAHEQTRLELHLSALLPEDYIGDPPTRLALYKRLADIADPPALETLQNELRERFGPLPEAARHLFRLTALRLTAMRLGLRRLELHARGGELEPGPDHSLDPALLVDLIREDPQRYRIRDNEHLGIRADLAEPETRLRTAEQLLEYLASAGTPEHAQTPTARP